VKQECTLCGKLKYLLFLQHVVQILTTAKQLISIWKNTRRRWEDNNKMDLEEVGRGGRDWMELAQDRDRWRALVSTVMNFRVP
jgi:hypothetical protein